MGLCLGGQLLENPKMVQAARKFLDASIEAPHAFGSNAWSTRMPIWTAEDFVDIISLRLRL